MSRLGKMPITVPAKVEVKTVDGKVQVAGPKGNLSLPMHKGIVLRTQDNRLFVERDEKIEMSSAEHGLQRALINNMVIGVSRGFEVRLSLIGVGYRAAVQ